MQVVRGSLHLHQSLCDRKSVCWMILRVMICCSSLGLESTGPASWVYFALVCVVVKGGMDIDGYGWKGVRCCCIYTASYSATLGDSGLHERIPVTLLCGVCVIACSGCALRSRHNPFRLLEPVHRHRCISSPCNERRWHESAPALQSLIHTSLCHTSYCCKRWRRSYIVQMMRGTRPSTGRRVQGRLSACQP